MIQTIIYFAIILFFCMTLSVWCTASILDLAGIMFTPEEDDMFFLVMTTRTIITVSCTAVLTCAASAPT